MEIIRLIQSKVHGTKYNFLLIGGFAAANYVPGRSTADIDLMTRKEDRAYWEEMLVGCGYQVSVSATGFSHFTFPQPGQWAVDVMFVNADTFESMLRDSVEVLLYNLTIRIPSANHLMRMKLHSLKTRTGAKRAVDQMDVVGLLKHMNLDPGSEEFKQLCLKYANIEVYEEFSSGKIG
jgi:hypothetical protein